MKKLKITDDQRKVLYYCFRYFSGQPVPAKRNACLTWWVSQVQAAVAQRPFWSTAQRLAIERCVSRRLDLTSPWYRFCRQDWWCPFCYARRMVVPCLAPLLQHWLSDATPLRTTAVSVVWRWGERLVPEQNNSVLTLLSPPSRLKLRRFDRFFAGLRLLIPAWDAFTQSWRWQERSVWRCPSVDLFPRWFDAGVGQARSQVWRGDAWQALTRRQRWRILRNWVLAYPSAWLTRPDGGWWLTQRSFRWRARCGYGLVRQ